MNIAQDRKLKGLVEVDEFEIDGPQKGEEGRKKSQKKIRAVIAIERMDNHLGRLYIRHINDYSAQALAPIFKQNVDSTARVRTDGWRSCASLKNQGIIGHLEQEISDYKFNFQSLHIQIRNFKNWLRGTHSKCSLKHA